MRIGTIGTIDGSAQLPCQLEGDTRATKLVERCAGVGQAGMDDRVGIGKRLVILVMIGNHQADTKIACCLRRLVAGNPAIDRNDDFGALLVQASDAVGMDPVTLVKPIRDVKAWPGTGKTKGFEQNGTATHAVDIVIAVHPDRLAVAASVGKQGRGLFDPGKSVGKMEARQAPFQESPTVFRRANATVQKQLPHHRVNIQLFAELFRAFGFAWQQIPLT